MRAAMVVLDFLDAEPVAVTQSPTAMALTASVADLENVVVVVQLTVVCPVLALCTSMLVPLSAATLPVAPPGALGGEAAPAVPAVAATVPTASSAAAPVPRIRAQLRFGVWRGVGVSMVAVASFFSRVMGLIVRTLVGGYSVRRASIGASDAARLAGYTPKRTPIARAIASAPTAAVGLVEMGSPIKPGR